jgi:hypothetical protein
VSNQSDDISFGSLARSRWNVLDLITIFTQRTRPAVLISDIDVTTIENLRARLAARGNKITTTAFLLKAISIAQIKFPLSRSFRLPSGKLITAEKPVAGFTVERPVGDQPTVFFANIHDAQTKPLKEIAAELQQYGSGDLLEVPQLAKEVKLTRLPWIARQVGIWIGMRIPVIRQLVNPATFGMTSLGKFGMQTLIAPNITTSIFGVGSIEPRPKVGDDDKIEVRKLMTMTFAVDTAVMPVSDAASLLSDIKDLIESGLKGQLSPEEEIEDEVVPLHPKQNIDLQKRSA